MMDLATLSMIKNKNYGGGSGGGANVKMPLVKEISEEENGINR
jgi:hypothetical protein